MRIVPWAVLLALGGGVAAAQAIFPSYGFFGAAGITGAPYSAKQTTVRIQTAADGKQFSTTEVMLLWRDAEGRTRQETLRKVPSGQDYRSISVMDPIARIRISWATHPAGVENWNKYATIWPLIGPFRTGPPRWQPHPYRIVAERQQ